MFIKRQVVFFVKKRVQTNGISTDMKLIIAMGDRYSLGFWDTDAYALKYGIVGSGTAGQAQQVANAATFYTSNDAMSFFDKRIKHVLNHKNALLGNKPWSQLDNVIYAIEPQNEPMGHMNLVSTSWNCDRAATIQSQLPSGSSIQISTGGGITIQASLQNWAFNCPHFDIVSVHDYGTDVSTSISALQWGQQQAKQSGKIVVFEEWGANGYSKASIIGAFVPALQKAGIPHLIWEIVNPGAGSNDFEIWTNEPSWNVFQSNAKNLPYKLSKRAVEAVQDGFQVVQRAIRRPLYKRSPAAPSHAPDTVIVEVKPLSKRARRLQSVNRMMQKLQ